MLGKRGLGREVDLGVVDIGLFGLDFGRAEQDGGVGEGLSPHGLERSGVVGFLDSFIYSWLYGSRVLDVLFRSSCLVSV